MHSATLSLKALFVLEFACWIEVECTIYISMHILMCIQKVNTTPRHKISILQLGGGGGGGGGGGELCYYGEGLVGSSLVHWFGGGGGGGSGLIPGYNNIRERVGRILNIATDLF